MFHRLKHKNKTIIHLAKKSTAENNQYLELERAVELNRGKKINKLGFTKKLG